MRDELNVVCRKSLQLGAAFGLTLAVSTQAFALKAGHGRVDSLSGAALRVSIPLLEVPAADVATLKAKLAAPAAWAKAGLTPPVSLDSMTVSIEAGFTKDSRTLVLRSNQIADKQIIDVLVEVSSASGSTQVQSSFLVLTRANEGVGVGSVIVKAGDTLSGIALANPVAGADFYQMLWALYQANPQAFFSQNMNLLKAGVTLKMPEAQTVRAVDPKLAREMYQKHLAAFNGLRGGSNTQTAAPRTPVVAAPAGAAQSSSVATVSAAPPPTAGTDRVLLTSANTTEQQADVRVSSAKELAEIQARVDSLQQNVDQLKNALNQSPNASSSTSTGAASTGAPGSAGAAGAKGSIGATGAAGAAGTAGASSAAGSVGGPGAAGAVGAAGSGSSVAAAGTAGSAGTASAAGSVGAAGAPGAASTAGTAGSTGAAGAAGAPSAAGSVGATGATGASGAAGVTSGVGAATAATNTSAQGTLAQLWSKFSTSAVGVLTASLALGGLLVAWLLRRASARRELDEVEGEEVHSPLDPTAKAALDQKLKEIDLDLSMTGTTTKTEPSIVAPSSSPKI
jgi:pilus assembly protein FimV